MFGPEILVRSLTVPDAKVDPYGNRWQYNPRGDRHSKIACWGVFFDLMLECPLLRQHVSERKVVFGINHRMGNYRHQQPKKLDLVIARPGTAPVKGKVSQLTFNQLADHWRILLSEEEQSRLDELPEAVIRSVAVVLVALEAKATMTAHQKSLPRLHDELDSSHATVHGSSDYGAATALAMVNIAPEFISPLRNPFDLRTRGAVVNRHNQPRAAELVVNQVEQMPRSGHPGEVGFDAIGIVVVNCRNDGAPVTLHHGPPAPGPESDFNYAQMILRLSGIYATRFANI